MPKRIVVRSLAIAIIPIAMLIAACRSGQQPGESWIHDSGQHSTPVPAAKNGEIKDPIVAMLPAASVDKKGRVVNPKFTFDAAEPQITVIVQVGKVTNGQLDVVWYQVTDSGDQKLFEHHLQVASYERAYSIGKNPGLFASGSYKVVATLAGQTKSIEFSVKERAAPTKKSEMPASTESVRADLTGETPWPFAGGMYNVATFVVPLKTIAFDWILGAPPATGAPPASEQQGKPPVSGPSGKIAAPSLAPSAVGCELLLYNFGMDDHSTIADRVDIVADHRSCSGVIFDVTATVEGPPVMVGTVLSAQGSAAFYVDPCSLPGGKDLPGTKVRFNAGASRAEGSTFGLSYDRKTPSPFVITLGNDTSPPHVNVVSTPARGTKVKPGDKISLKIKANEARSGESWQTGVKVIQTTAEPGGLVKDPWVNPSKLPKPCAQKTWEQQDEAIYTVPRSPPPIIKICVLAEDYVGNQGATCGEFYTGKVWTGTIHATATMTATTPGGIKGPFTGAYDGKLTLVEGSDGVITGHGQVSASGCQAPVWVAAKWIVFDVTGIDNGKQLNLQIVPSSFRVDGGRGNCGFGYGWSPVAGSPTSATIPITATGVAEGKWEGRGTPGASVYTASYQVNLSEH